MVDNKPENLVELLKLAVQRYKKAEAFKYKQDGKWVAASSEEFYSRVKNVALGLHQLGVSKGDHVALLGETSLLWSLTDYAILSNGAVNIPIYPTQASHQVEYILRESQPRAIFVLQGKQLDRLRSVLERFPDLKVITPEPGDGPFIKYAELESSGAKLNSEKPHLYDEISSQIQPSDLASVIYTSGTTGEPKGVMLTHHNITFNVIQGGLTIRTDENDVALTFLPLSHIFERMVLYLYTHFGTTICYAESIEAVPQNLREVRPTIMTAVPRLFEKIYDKITKTAKAASPVKRKIFNWAMSVGLRWAQLEDRGEPVSPLLELQHKIASHLVFSKWREAVGGRIQRFISGGAALRPDIAYAFWGAGLPIMQGYGLTETSPVISVNTFGANRIGTVGRPLQGIEVKIAEDGEILTKGDHVMLGYYKKPEETASVIVDGWFKTGDIGHVDKDGYITITDRKKDLMKLSSGKYIAPQFLEGLLQRSPYIEQAVVMGNKRKYPVALIVPSFEAIKEFAQSNSIKFDSRSDLYKNSKVVDLIRREVDSLTKDTADYEKIKRIALLDNEFSIDGGELTPTLKVRRRVVEEKYSSLIESLYPREAAAKG